MGHSQWLESPWGMCLVYLLYYISVIGMGKLYPQLGLGLKFYKFPNINKHKLLENVFSSTHPNLTLLIWLEGTNLLYLLEGIFLCTVKWFHLYIFAFCHNVIDFVILLDICLELEAALQIRSLWPYNWGSRAISLSNILWIFIRWPSHQSCKRNFTDN